MFQVSGTGLTPSDNFHPEQGMITVILNEVKDLCGVWRDSRNSSLRWLLNEVKGSQ